MLTVSALTRLHISVSFELKDGECIALQGPSGVGKSLIPWTVVPDLSSALKMVNASIIYWPGVPLGVKDYDAVRDEILRRINELLPTLPSD